MKKVTLGMLAIVWQFAASMATAGPLHDAAVAGDVEQVRSLLAGGADADEPDSRGVGVQELLRQAMAVLSGSGVADTRERALPATAWYAEVFAANPDKLKEWRRIADKQKRPARDVLRRAFQLQKDGNVPCFANRQYTVTDDCWGAYFASGNPAHVYKVVEQLRHWDDRHRDEQLLAWGFIHARVAAQSLARIVRHHPRVRTALELLPSGTDARSRAIVADLLRRDPQDYAKEMQRQIDQFIMAIRRAAPPTR